MVKSESLLLFVVTTIATVGVAVGMAGLMSALLQVLLAATTGIIERVRVSGAGPRRPSARHGRQGSSGWRGAGSAAPGNRPSRTHRRADTEGARNERRLILHGGASWRAHEYAGCA